MDAKRKAGAPRLKSDLDLESPLPPDEVLRRLQALSLEDVQLTQEAEQPGALTLRFDYLPQNAQTRAAYARLRLRPWMGTGTRIHVDGYAQMPPVITEWIKPPLMALATMILCTVVLLLYFSEAWIIYDWGWLLRSWILPVAGLTGVIVGLFTSYHEDMRQMNLHHRQSLRALDELMRRLSVALHAVQASDEEDDPPHDWDAQARQMRKT